MNKKQHKTLNICRRIKRTDACWYWRQRAENLPAPQAARRAWPGSERRGTRVVNRKGFTELRTANPEICHIWYNDFDLSLEKSTGENRNWCQNKFQDMFIKNDFTFFAPF